MTEKELRAELKSGTVRPAYLFVGDEEYLKRVSRRLLRDTVCPDADYLSFNYLRRSAADTPASALEDDLAALPFFAERRLVELCDADMNLLSGTSLDTLAALFERDDLFESTVLCICMTPGAVDFSNKKSAAKLEDVLTKKLGGRMTPVRFDTPAPAELQKWVARHIEHDGIACPPDVARALIERSGKNMDVLANETEKLACYAAACGRGTATLDDLEAVSTNDPDLGAFALSNAILSGKTADALDALQAAKRDKEKPTAFLAGITASFSDLVTVRELAAAGLSDAEAGRRAGMNEYKVKLCRIAALKSTSAILEKALTLCIECDGILKSGTNGFAPVERLLCELAALRREGER